MEQQEYWNHVSGQKAFTTPFQAEEFAKHVAKQGMILDVGCGYGRTLAQLYQMGYHTVVGMDFAQGMIARGKAQYPYLDLRVSTAAEIALPDASADAVILFAVLTCIREDAAQKKLIQEIKRVLKPQGILYVNDFLLNTDPRNVSRYQEFEKKYGTYGVFELPEGAVCRHHSTDWIEALLAGFEAIQFENLVFTTMNGHQSNGFYFIGRNT
ncbi:MAG: class I SAM-dependent methyltransferase [Gemmiger sp.]|nr:class I SAM-dependent methyltransferase [Gemmiger sp.]